MHSIDIQGYATLIVPFSAESEMNMILGGYHAVRRTGRLVSIITLFLSLLFLWVSWHIDPLIAALSSVAVFAAFWFLYVTFRERPIIPLVVASPWEGSAFEAPPFDDEIPLTRDKNYERDG